MDAKALAKSKRAHSLHLNKKHNPHHASKGSSGDKKPTVKQVKEKPKPKLPSNWDRYEDENSDSETATQAGTSDVVLPKSKGADYAYLLSEAKSQFQYSSESVSFSDDILDDFYQGLGALLSAKGQSKLSWIAEDNFAQEDKAPPPTKASFLSLDLQALSEQLERASLHERLFIEPDLLPLVLSAEESQAAAKEKHDSGLDSSKSSAAEKDSNLSTSTSVNENRHQHSEFSHLGTTTSSSRHPTLVDESSNPSNAFKDDTGQSKGAGGQNDTLMYASEFSMSSSSKKSSAFNTAAAEAELDMLLDSVTEIEIFESTNVTDQSIRPYPVTQAGTATIQEVSTQPKRGQDLAKSNEVNSIAGHTPSASQPVAKTKINDDFDSWFDSL